MKMKKEKSVKKNCLLCGKKLIGPFLGLPATFKRGWNDELYCGQCGKALVGAFLAGPGG